MISWCYSKSGIAGVHSNEAHMVEINCSRADNRLTAEITLCGGACIEPEARALYEFVVKTLSDFAANNEERIKDIRQFTAEAESENLKQAFEDMRKMHD